MPKHDKPQYEPTPLAGRIYDPEYADLDAPPNLHGCDDLHSSHARVAAYNAHTTRLRQHADEQLPKRRERMLIHFLITLSLVHLATVIAQHV